ncbi:MAG: glycine betaine ABC transporter substrate-binding protein, partial [Pseudomonadota bacterium]
MSLVRPVMITLFLLLALLLGKGSFAQTSSKSQVTVGSKMFPENYVLAEMLALLLEEEGFPVVRKFGLGGTIVAYKALEKKK